MKLPSGKALALLTALSGLAPATTSRAQGRERPQAPVAATAAVMSADTLLVASQTGSSLRLWERSSGALRATFDNHWSLFRGAVAPGVLAGIAEEKPVVWSGPRFTAKLPMRDLPRVTTFGRVFLSPDGKLLGALFPKAGDARDPDSFGVWGSRTGDRRAVVHWEAGCRVHGLVFGPGGHYPLLVAYGDEPGQHALMRLYRLAGPPKLLLAWSSASETSAFSAAISPDGKRLALGAGERIFLWDLSRPTGPLLGSVPSADARQLFPRALQVPSVQIPGAHQLHFSADGKHLASLHGFGVVGVAVWELTPGASTPMKPVRWVRRPPAARGGSFRQIGWDASGQLWLITAAYGATVVVHRARGDQFTIERELTPDR